MTLSPVNPPKGAVLVPTDDLQAIAQWVKTTGARLWRDGRHAWVQEASGPRPSLVATDEGLLDPERVVGVTPWSVAVVNGLLFTAGTRTLYSLRTISLRRLYRAGFRFRHHPVRYWRFNREQGQAELFVALRLVPLTSTPWL